MKKINYLLSVLIIINLSSCLIDEDCDLEKNMVNLEMIKEEFNNPFEIYEGSESFLKLKNNSPCDYKIKYKEIFDSDDSLFMEKVEKRQDSLNISMDSLGSLQIEYQYYISGLQPIIPHIIMHQNHLTIRCKTELDAAVQCNNGKYIIQKMYSLVDCMYTVNIFIKKEQLDHQNLIIFEPFEDRSYIINLEEFGTTN